MENSTMKRFNFNLDFYESCLLLGDEAKDLAWALLSYGYRGEEPEGLSDHAMAVFKMSQGRIDAMVSGSRGGNESAKRRSQQDPAQGGSQDPTQPPCLPPTQPPRQGGAQHPKQLPRQQKEKEKEIVPTVHKDHCQAEPPDDPIPYSEIVGYFNEKAGTDYRPTADRSRKPIRARWNDGFRVDDFKTVIDAKTAEWLGNPDMAKYLRPETVFGPKFEGYLQTAPLTAKANGSGTLPNMRPDYSGEGWW